jgi:hypothetical protein
VRSCFPVPLLSERNFSPLILPLYLWTEPLGYEEERRIQYGHDDLVQLAEDDVRDLISASRKICYNLALKNSRTCNIRELIEKMYVLPDIVTDLQASSARGAAQMALAMCLCRYPNMDLNDHTCCARWL